VHKFCTRRWVFNFNMV